MNTMVLHSQKNQLAQRVLGESSVLHIGRMVNYLDQIQFKHESYGGCPSLATTDEEIRADIELAMQDYYSGRFIFDEDLVKEIKSWECGEPRIN